MSNHVLKTVLTILLVSLGSASCESPLAAQEPPRQVERPEQVVGELKSLWKEGRWSRISTAEFTVEYFRLQHMILDKPISVARMHEFLDQVKLVWQGSADPSHVRALSTSLPINRHYLPSSWLNGKITIRGKEIRNTFEPNLIPGAYPDPHDTSYAGGVDVFYVGSSKQASLFQTQSRWHKFGLSDMCYPEVPDIDTFSVADVTPTTVRLRRDGWEYEIDRQSKGITWVRSGDNSEIWQCGFSDYVGGDGLIMTVPSITASIEYSDGVVTTCYLFVKKSVRFNIDLGDAAFRVPVPAGTNIVLYGDQEQQNSIGSMRIQEDSADVASLLPKISLRERRSETDSPYSLRFWLIAGNVGGVLLVVLGIWLIRSHRRRIAR